MISEMENAKTKKNEKLVRGPRKYIPSSNLKMFSCLKFQPELIGGIALTFIFSKLC